MFSRCFGLSSKRKRTSSSSPHGSQGVHIPTHIAQFSFNELRSATDDFSMSNKLGRGGFGIVYKGVLRNGIQVAVKRLSVQSKQGSREFLTEIDTIANLKHPNLVHLVGCCVEGANRILVYEYLENNSLDRALLYGGGFSGAKINLNWPQRSAICLGIAQGLAFLHEEADPHIVHRDIKASNILLDKDFKPKIGDFGLAKLFPDDITHISTRIAGTTGYLAPEYAMGGQLTMKADVYSFGVLILEIVSGRSSTRLDWEAGQRFLLELAWQLYKNGEMMKVIDPELVDFPEEELVRYIKVAFFCTQAASNRRPTMGQVLEMLSKKIRINEKEITAPGFFQGSARSGEKPSSSKDPSTDSSYQMSNVPSTITQIWMKNQSTDSSYQMSNVPSTITQVIPR